LYYARFFSNTLINIPDSGNASPYPSGINVQGLTGKIEKVRVVLTGLSHTYPDDLDLLLVGPQGQKVILMSDAGGGSDLNNTQLFFEQSASASLSFQGQIVSGSYRPTNYGTNDTFPGVAGSFSSSLNVFNTTNPNGIWKLYVVDGSGGDSGQISGWRLDLDTNVTTPGNLIKNGSFESGPNPNWYGGYLTLNSGSTALGSWLVTQGSIDLMDEAWEASEGFRSLDLNGNEPGAISQTFKTTPGQKYKVSFDLAGNPDGGTQIKKLRVTGAGQSANFSFDSMKLYGQL